METSSNEQGGDSLANDWRTQHDTQNPTSQQWLPQNNIHSNLHSPESSGLPTQVPITVSAAQNLNIQMSEEGVHSNLLLGPQREIQGRQQSSNTMFQHQMDHQLPYMQLSQPMMLQHYQPNNPVQHQQPQNITLNQQNHPYQLQGANPSSTSGGDWREETYQKIKALKEKYSLVLSETFQAFSDKVREIDSLPQQNMPNVQVEKIRMGKAKLERVLMFLNVSRNSISENHRDRFSLYEGKVLKLIGFYQRRMQEKQVHLPPFQIHQTALQSQSGQEHVSQSLESDQMSSRLMLSHQNEASSSPSMPNANRIQTSSQEHPLPPEPISDRPIDRLIKAIQSSSPENLAQSVSEMSRVISLTDRFAGSVHTIGGSRARLGEDLSERTRFHLLQGDTNPTKSFKRSVTATPLDSSPSSSSKVNKIEPGCALLQELNEINGRLVETVVSLCNEDVGPSEVTSGTVVTCSYVPVALSATFLYNSGHISQIQPLRLLVPENYPCSPILLEKGHLFNSDSVHKHEDLSGRARSRFGLSMREYSEPMSLKEIAKAWEECARATMVEYAERHGGGTFSSKYGRWESVLRSS